MSAGSDLYEVLGVPQDATQSEIRRAYRKLALKFHPDKVSVEKRQDAEIKFKDITHAYEILGDEDKRRDYNLYGEREPGLGFDEDDTEFSYKPSPFANAAFNGSGSFDFSPDDFANFFNGMGMDMNDDFFTSMGNGSRARQAKPPQNGTGKARKPPKPSPDAERNDAGNGKTMDAHFNVRLSLLDLFNGKVVKLSETRDRICEKCNGTGLKRKAVEIGCLECNGVGYMKKYRHINGMTLVQTIPCEKCSGAGVYFRPKDYCKHCRGSGLIKESKILEFNVPKGSPNKGTVVLPGESDEVPGLKTGDVILNYELELKPLEKRFQRQDNDLYTKVSVSLVDALCGFNRSNFVKSLDGRWLSISIPPGKVLRPGDCIVIPNEGMPVMDNYIGRCGDLYVGIDIEFPKDNWALERNDFAKLRSILDITYGSERHKDVTEEDTEATKIAYKIKEKDELPLDFNSFNANTEVKNIGTEKRSKGWFSKWF